MILASSNEGDLVLDPFWGSGTLLRVCQNINRNAIGIEKNPEYVKMSLECLEEEFSGFDSIDECMKRVPNDLNDACIREEYIINHIEWFLKNHKDAINEFWEEVKTSIMTRWSNQNNYGYSKNTEAKMKKLLIKCKKLR